MKNIVDHIYLSVFKKIIHSAFVWLAGTALILTIIADAQGQRVIRQIKKQERRQQMLKKIEERQRENLSPTENTSSTSNRNRPARHSLDGISQRGIVTLFSKEERELIIPGFGRAPALLVIFRQLDLTDDQKLNIKALRAKVGTQLVDLRLKTTRSEQQLEDTIYGENFDTKKVEEFSSQVASTQGELTKLQAEVESQFRQILTPDQFLVFRFLVGEMLLPQRRMTPAQMRQQQQNQRRIPSPQNQQVPPQ